MTPDQIVLVQQSFRAVVPIKEQAASIFYERLFTLDPSLRHLFARSDMARQGAMLMSTLGFVVAGLGRPGTILPDVQALARRHVGYGVRDRDYATVGQALVETLALGLGEAFTGEVRDAWLAAYALLSGHMRMAAVSQAA